MTSRSLLPEVSPHAHLSGCQASAFGAVPWRAQTLLTVIRNRVRCSVRLIEACLLSVLGSSERCINGVNIREFILCNRVESDHQRTQHPWPELSSLTHRRGRQSFRFDNLLAWPFISNPDFPPLHHTSTRQAAPRYSKATTHCSNTLFANGMFPTGELPSILVPLTRLPVVLGHHPVRPA